MESGVDRESDTPPLQRRSKQGFHFVVFKNDLQELSRTIVTGWPLLPAPWR
jgi:hypothetical protein